MRKEVIKSESCVSIFKKYGTAKQILTNSERSQKRFKLWLRPTLAEISSKRQKVCSSFYKNIKKACLTWFKNVSHLDISISALEAGFQVC